MKSKMSFIVQSLLFYTDQVKGPLEQVMFAQKIARFLQMDNFNQLARVEFSEPKVHKTFTGQELLIECLIIGNVTAGQGEQHIVVRAKETGLFVATGYLPERTVEFHEDYKSAILMEKLADADINLLFNYLWDNPSLLEFRPATPEDWES